MCGICGMVGFNNKDLLKKMCQVMKHRGPDDEGTYINAKCKMQNAKCQVGLGVRRFKISEGEIRHQVVHNESKTIWAICDSEIYNHQELRQRLEKEGHHFFTLSDAELIVHLYEEKDEDCVKDLWGVFAFALWDENKQKLFLARDKIGVKPLNYALQDGILFFASEIKALLQCPQIKREINFKALDYYLTFLYIPAPETILEGIKKLLPGYTLNYQNSKIKIKKYWDLKFPGADIKTARLDEKEYNERLYHHLQEAVRIRLKDSPGIFISGGIDSSVILAIMNTLADYKIKTFSIGYGKEARAYNEFPYSRLLAKHFQTDHHEFNIKPDIPKILPKFIFCLDEPFADSGAVANYIISELAKKDTDVVLVGSGGDEAFAGYPRYLGARLVHGYLKIPHFVREKIIARAVEGLPESARGSQIVNRLRRFVQAASLPPQERYISWLSPFTTAIKEKLYTQDTKEELKNFEVGELYKSYFESVKDRDFLEQMFYVDLKTYVTNDLMVIGDRMGMAHSLVIRAPFCDYKLLEHSTTIPPTLKLKGFTTKYILRKSVEHLLPPAILKKRKKQGFMIPMPLYLQRELKDLTSRVLFAPKAVKRNYFNPDYVKELLMLHYKGKRNYSNQIWALLVFEIWHRMFIDKEPRSIEPTYELK